VSWAGHQPEQLGHRVQEVENLGQEEQQHRLAEVAENSNNCKSHPREVAKGVANKNSAWVPAIKFYKITTLTQMKVTENTPVVL